MTRIFDDPARFMDDMLQGFSSLYSNYVSQVSGGVVRAEESAQGKVSVLVGGGSGHYPAFCGIVGHGFADGAIVGNIFTSPSAQDAVNVAVAADNGGGVVITSGNYAGDVLHFTEAAEILTRNGIPARTVFVTDDIASAPRGEESKRRGIAGDFVVFKVMSAAAEAGRSLDEVVRVGHKANDATRTLGVAFSGCTLPGGTEPLFSVPDGKMGVGLGIHGEPGVSEESIPSARKLARRLVDETIAELDLESGNRVGVILNGLGATKYEELFVLWLSVEEFLRDYGLEIIDPEVGELVTSLDMAGLSLTLVRLDDELEGFWRAPADTPAYKKGSLQSRPKGAVRRTLKTVDLANHSDVRESSERSREHSATLVKVFETMLSALEEAETELGRIDAVAGDGDHGRGMVKGARAALEAAREAVTLGAGLEQALEWSGEAWASKAGGTSGALWGAGLRRIGQSIGDQPDGIPHLLLAESLRDALNAIVELGKAQLGDKTLIDALSPFVDVLLANVEEGASIGSAWAVAARAATDAAEQTAQLIPKIGRARPLAERSLGTPDPGAVSLGLVVTAIAKHFD